MRKKRDPKSFLVNGTTIKDLAADIGVHKNTVRSWIKLGEQTKGREGLYPVYKLGYRSIIIPRSSVESFLGGCLS